MKVERQARARAKQIESDNKFFQERVYSTCDLYFKLYIRGSTVYSEYCTFIVEVESKEWGTE